MLSLGFTAAAGWFWAKRIEPRLVLQPTGEALREIVTAPHALIYRIRDTVEYECHCPQPVRFQDLSPAFIKVLVGTEDRGFWNHSGIDWWAILRAVFVNMTSGEVRSGASTLTQQLVKMKLLSPDQSLERKVLEAVLARRVSDLLTKEEVLAAYANAAWFA